MPAGIDYSEGVRGKFYRPGAKLNLPVYLDDQVQSRLAALANARKHDLARIAAGGNRSSGGSYQLVGTLGQNTAGRANAGGYQLQIGFHGAASNAPLPDSIFRNSFEN